MKEQINVLLVEDEYLTRQALSDLLQEHDYAISGEAISAAEAISVLQERQTDIAILDITIKGGRDGIWIGNQIKEKYNIPFIYLTANGDRQTVERGIATQPHSYLLKPFNETNILTAIELALNRFMEQQESDPEMEEESSCFKIQDAIFVRDGHSFLKVPLTGITYLASDKNYVDIFTTNKKFVVRTTLSEISKMVGENFIQVHRSYVVNLKHVDQFSSASITVGGKIIPLSKTHQKEFYSRFSKIE